MQDWLNIAAFVAVLGLTVMIVPVLRTIALRVGLVDRPDLRRRHESATPAVGGLAILLAVAVVRLFNLPITQPVAGVGLAALVIMVGGVADDLMRLSWPYRLGIHLCAALIMFYVGGLHLSSLGEIFGLDARSLGVLSAPITVLATVGVINAMNMIDGLDGLAGSVALMSTAMLAAVATYAGNHVLAAELLLLAGGVCGFLVFNLRTPWNKRASIFLGNAGAELIGLIIAATSIRLSMNGRHPIGPELAPFLIAVPLFDCLTLSIRRIRSGVSPFLGDRNHLHHLLLDAGFTATWAVVFISVAVLAIGLTAILAKWAQVPAVFFSIAFLGLWAAYFAATRRRDRSVTRLSQLRQAFGAARSNFNEVESAASSKSAGWGTRTRT